MSPWEITTPRNSENPSSGNICEGAIGRRAPDVVDDAVELLGDLVRFVPCHVLSKSGAVDLAPGATRPPRHTLHFREQIVGDRHRRLHTGSITTTDGRLRIRSSMNHELVQPGREDVVAQGPRNRLASAGGAMTTSWVVARVRPT